MRPFIRPPGPQHPAQPGREHGAALRPLSVHNPPSPPPNPHVAQGCPSLQWGCHQGRVQPGTPSPVRPRSTDNLRDTTHLFQFVSAARRTPLPMRGWRGRGALRAPHSYTRLYKWLPSCFLSKKEDAALQMDGRASTPCPPHPRSPGVAIRTRSLPSGHGLHFPELPLPLPLVSVPFPGP